jgi:hypothetical protein
MAELFEKKDRTATWKDQYSVVDKDSYVSANEVFREYLANHLLPVVFKKPAGWMSKKEEEEEVGIGDCIDQESVCVIFSSNH